MAIDTEQKRKSALMFWSVWNPPAVIPTGDLSGQATRQQMLWAYSGISAPVPTSDVPAIFEIRLVQKIIAVLKATSGVTQFTGSGDSARIYGGFISSLTDFILPSVAIRIIPSPGRTINGTFLDIVNVSIEVWMPSVGAHARVWDDLVECQKEIVDALHRTKIWDDSIGVKPNESTNSGGSGQVPGEHGLMMLSSEWRFFGKSS